MMGRWDFRRDGGNKASFGYYGRKGKHKSTEDWPTWGERCGKKNHFTQVCTQKATTQLYQQEYLEESSSNESTLLQRKLQKKKKKRSNGMGGTYTDEDKKQ